MPYSFKQPSFMLNQPSQPPPSHPNIEGVRKMVRDDISGALLSVSEGYKLKTEPG